MRRFELVDGKSSKFWEVDTEGKDVIVRFGKIGTNGQTQTKSFPTPEKAKTEHHNLVKEKTRKGYSEVTTSSDRDEETPSATPDDGAPDGAAEPAIAARIAKPKTSKKEAPKPESSTSDDGWVDASNGYKVALVDGKLVAMNARGQKLASVPKDVRESEAAEQLGDLRDWLLSHEKECKATIETWMLRSLPAPRVVLEAVWEDESYRKVLENAVVVPLDANGKRSDESGGFLRGVDPARGIGVVTLDGETTWLKADAVLLPHPILIADLQDFRALAMELGITQGLSQLLRETYTKPADLKPSAMAVRDFVGGEFQQLNHALGLCRRHGFRVSGGWSVTRVWEGGQAFEARFWIGSEDPSVSTWTDELVWVSEDERSLAVASLGPVAYSEGMRMGTQIFAGRVLPKEKPDA